MKRNKNGDYEMDLETYKMMLEDIVYGRGELMRGVTLKKETRQMAKAKLEEIKQLEMSNTQ